MIVEAITGSPFIHMQEYREIDRNSLNRENANTRVVLLRYFTWAQ